MSGKFAATKAEKARDGYEELGPQLVSDPITTEKAFIRAVKKLKKGKACGPDGIPGEVFANCESAARELFRVLKMIWSTGPWDPIFNFRLLSHTDCDSVSEK